MLAEHHEVLDADDVVLVVAIVMVQVLEDAQLHASLVLELLLVADDLDRDGLASLVVQAFDCLPEAALAEELEHLVAVPEVVLEDDLIVTLLVVIAVVEYVHLAQTLFQALHELGRLASALQYVALDLLAAVLADVVDCTVVLEHLLALVVRHAVAVVLQGRVPAHGQDRLVRL